MKTFALAASVSICSCRVLGKVWWCWWGWRMSDSGLPTDTFLPLCKGKDDPAFCRYDRRAVCCGWISGNRKDIIRNIKKWNTMKMLYGNEVAYWGYEELVPVAGTQAGVAVWGSTCLSKMERFEEANRLLERRCGWAVIRWYIIWRQKMTIEIIKKKNYCCTSINSRNGSTRIICWQNSTRKRVFRKVSFSMRLKPLWKRAQSGKHSNTKWEQMS